MAPQRRDFAWRRGAEFLLKDLGRVIGMVLPDLDDNHKEENDRHDRCQGDCADNLEPARFNDEANDQKETSAKSVGQEEDSGEKHVNSHDDLAPEK